MADSWGSSLGAIALEPEHLEIRPGLKPIIEQRVTKLVRKASVTGEITDRTGGVTNGVT